MKNKNSNTKPEFNSNYLNRHARSLIYPNYLSDMYNEGKVVEAFTILHGNLEQYLNSLWTNILVQQLGKGNAIPSFNYKFKHKWKFFHLIRVLNEFQILTDEEFEHFKNFISGRNVVVHILPTLHNSEVKRKRLDFEFEEGLEAFEILKKKVNSTKPQMDRKILENLSEKFKDVVKIYERTSLENQINISEDPLDILVDIEK